MRFLSLMEEDSGAMIRVGIKTLAKLGACRELLWPYDTDKFTRKPVARCYTEAKGHLVTSCQRLANLQEMKACKMRRLQTPIAPCSNNLQIRC